MSETEVPVKPKKRKVRKKKTSPKTGPPERKKQPLYRVVLWNDDDHTVEYVVRMMAVIFKYDLRKGLQIAMRVHYHGKAVVATEPLEVAELRRDQIRTFGGDAEVEGCYASMFATVEPVE